MQLVNATYDLVATFPAEERFGLASQMCRAAVSVPSNIAEGYVRASRKDYTRYVTVAFGSAAEPETQIEIAKM